MLTRKKERRQREGGTGQTGQDRTQVGKQTTGRDAGGVGWQSERTHAHARVADAMRRKQSQQSTQYPPAAMSSPDDAGVFDSNDPGSGSVPMLGQATSSVGGGGGVGGLGAGSPSFGAARGVSFPPNTVGVPAMVGESDLRLREIKAKKGGGFKDWKRRCVRCYVFCLVFGFARNGEGRGGGAGA